MITLDVNELPTHILIRLQNTVNQELTDRDEIISDHLVKSQEQEVLSKEEIERLKKVQEVEIMEKVKVLDDKE